MKVRDFMTYLKDGGLTFEQALEVFIILEDKNGNKMSPNEVSGVDFIHDNKKEKGILLKIKEQENESTTSN